MSEAVGIFEREREKEEEKRRGFLGYLMGNLILHESSEVMSPCIFCEIVE